MNQEARRRGPLVEPRDTRPTLAASGHRQGAVVLRAGDLHVEGAISLMLTHSHQSQAQRRCAFVARFVAQIQKSPATPYAAKRQNGEGGIPTRGTVTRTTVFEFYDSRNGVYHPVSNRGPSSPILRWRSRLVIPGAVLCRVVGLQFGLQIGASFLVGRSKGQRTDAWHPSASTFAFSPIQ